MDAAHALLPLAEAKLAAPRPRPALVERRRLLTALRAGSGSALTLVAAPPGYGKTTAVQAWCASQASPVAWLTLDRADNDPVRLWTYMATAVDRVHQGLGRRALQQLRLSGGAIENPVDELMNRVAAFSKHLVLVLDDFQEVTSPDALHSVQYAVKHLPASASLIVVTRSDPDLGLAQMRAQGALSELRAPDLAFTIEEARELIVGGQHLDLADEEMKQLYERTEGWPAALYLAAIWLRGVGDPHRAVQDFGGDHRFVADYLSHEVIRNLDDDSRAFLLRASVLSRFTAQLCDVVLDRSDSALKLIELERSNLFVEGLGNGDWFRVHPLFAEFARFQLEALDPGARVTLQRKAAAVLRALGLPDESAHHAAAAGDHELLASLLTEYHLHFLRHGQSQTLLHFARMLPEQELMKHPVLAAAAATAAANLGNRALEVRRFAQVAERGKTADPDHETPFLEVGLATVRAFSVDDDVSRAVREGARGVEIAQAAVHELLTGALAAYSAALYLAGQSDAAWTAALRAIVQPDITKNVPGHVVARTTLALIAVDRHLLRAARMHAERAKAIIGGIGNSRTWLGANASLAMGEVLAGEGNLVEAERYLVVAEGFFVDEVPTAHHAWVQTLLARVRCRRGRLVEAQTVLRSAREELDQLAAGGRLPALITQVEVELRDAHTRAAGGAILEPPSDAELAVLRLLPTDLSARDIGAKLFISLNTVRSHTRAIYAKLGVNSRAEAVARAQELGLVGR